MSLKEFERYLAKEMEVEKYRMDQHIHNIKTKYESKMNQCMFYLEAQEEAFLEYKIQARKQIDRANMYSGELESKLMNFVKQHQNVDKVIERIENGQTVTSMADARVLIEETKGIIKSKVIELMQ
jgi:hypothetical protein